MTHGRIVEAIRGILKQKRKPLHYQVILGQLSKDKTWKKRSGDLSRSMENALCRDLRRRDGYFFRVDRGVYALRVWVKSRLRSLIRRKVRKQGFILGRDGTVVNGDDHEKDAIRSFHSEARMVKLNENKRFLKEKAEKLIKYFANGSEISLSDFRPRLIEVKSESLEGDLFRFATLLWSAPVSQGFGRRIRFLVMDEHNGKLVGVFALGDPVFNLRMRDAWVGWDHKEREQRLYHVMDIFILGAVPPYNELLCGKLVALLAASNEVREAVQGKYAHRTTIIQKVVKDPRLALLTTTSALGRSSLYNRVTYKGKVIYQRAGFTQGWGHFHLSNGTFSDTHLVSMDSVYSVTSEHSLVD